MASKRRLRWFINAPSNSRPIKCNPSIFDVCSGSMYYVNIPIIWFHIKNSIFLHRAWPHSEPRNNARNEPLNLHFGILTQVWEKVTYSSRIFPEYRLQRLGIEVVKIDATSEVKIFLYDAALRHLWYHLYCFRILVTSNLRGQLLSLIFEYISHVFSIHGISVFLFLQAVSLH